MKTCTFSIADSIIKKINNDAGGLRMYDVYSRMELLLGQTGVDRLGRAQIAVFGLGGVGSYAVEALARCGVGSLTLVDHDVVSATNINRQLFALHSTIGRKKVQVAKERIRDIDENILVHTYETFYNKDTSGMFDLRGYDYIVDAIDSMESKLLLIEQAKLCHTPVISCLATEGKLNPSRFEITDISRTGNICPAAKKMRTELRKKGIRKVKVLYSRERCPKKVTEARNGEIVGGSISFVPSVAGMLIAGEVVRDILTENGKRVK